jgi:phosphoribosylanthranilate isomerase
MLIKICGMKIPENIQAVAALQPDFIGFIFYPKSPRFAEPLDIATLNALPKSIKKIGVFVNEDLENILTIATKYNLDGVQLHGNELGKMCEELHKSGFIVIKAFPIAEACNFKVTKKYEGACDYFLFDTKTDAYGGSGVKFNWSMLDEYVGETPFLLSGGIAADDAEAILKIDHPKFAGIDLNSKFEVKPGEKNVELLREFLNQLRNSTI